jgi:DnaJ-class molecular chaperone
MRCPNPKCRGSGFVMTRDPGVAGAEEYGTCPRCSGAGQVDEETAPETLARKVRTLEAKVRELEAKPAPSTYYR